MTRCLLLRALLVVTHGSSAAEYVGRVVRIADGDTLTLLVSQKQIRVRVAGIDVHEKKQPFGNKSRQNLAQLAQGKTARADCPKRDRYGREVCKVWVQPPDCPTCALTLDAGLAQIVAGLAWWFKRYADEQSAEDRGRYESEENEARLRKRGLWTDHSPVPPWEWRRSTKGG